MKMWPLYALTLSVATLFPCLAIAQAPAGVARVDSDTYFDTSNASWGYHNNQNNFAEYSGATANQSTPLPWWLPGGTRDDRSLESEDWRSGHAGLLGKAYIRGSYLYHNISAPSVGFDDSYVGWDAEINLPLAELTTDVSGVDFFVEHDNSELSGRLPISGDQVSFEHDLTIIGARISAYPDSSIRPFIALGAGSSKTDVQRSGGTNISREEEDSDLIVDLGFEADIATNAAFRADFSLLRGGDLGSVADGELDETTFEGTLILWPHRNVFFRTGLIVSLEDDLFDVGATAGGGLAY